MPDAANPPPQNKILAALPSEEYERLLPHLTPVSLPLGESLYETEDRIRYVYFVNTGVVSLVTHLKEGSGVEVGLTGNEGMVGLSIALGDDVSPNQAIVQIADGAMRMEAAALREELKGGGLLQTLLLRSTLALLKQVSQSAACNRSHHVAERLARWLLTCHDRVEGDELRLTQEFIAEMLGTRRAGVSEAAGILQGAGLIRYSRGHITITDRGGLEEFACECYAVVKAEYDRLLGT
jgi:CRP-like cAMP-binding protein